VNQVFSNIYPSKKQISRTFGLKADSYEQNASIQKDLIRLLTKRITKQSCRIWADLGCSTGLFEESLDNSNKYRIAAIDISLESLRALKTKKLNGVLPVHSDIEKLALKNGSTDGIIISSVLQWFPQNLKPVIESIAKLLKNKGVLLFSIFSSDCFRELIYIQKLFEIETPVILPDTNSFSSLLHSNNLNLVENEEYRKTLHFSSALNLLGSLSSIGSTAISGKRLTRKKLKEFCRKYEDIFGTSEGIPLTYHAITGTALKEG
jgi:malonyl-CoA O-methyltransferase